MYTRMHSAAAADNHNYACMMLCKHEGFMYMDYEGPTPLLASDGN